MSKALASPASSALKFASSSARTGSVFDASDSFNFTFRHSATFAAYSCSFSCFTLASRPHAVASFATLSAFTHSVASASSVALDASPSVFRTSASEPERTAPIRAV